MHCLILIGINNGLHDFVLLVSFACLSATLPMFLISSFNLKNIHFDLLLKKSDCKNKFIFLSSAQVYLRPLAA